MTGDRPILRALDLRLVPCAVAAWLVTWLGLNVSPTTSYVLAGIAGVAVLPAMRWRAPAGAQLALVSGVAAAAALAVGLRVGARDASPLIELAAHHASVGVTAVVADDPHPIQSAIAGPPEVAVPVRLQAATGAGRRWRLSGSALVLAPAATWAGLLPSQRFTAYGRLLPPRGGDLTVAVLSARGPPREVTAPSLLQRAAGGLRAGLRRACGRLPAGARGLLPGLVDGDVSGISPSLTASFRATGLTHLTAVSGANCTIISGAVLFLLRGLRVGPRTSAVCAGLALAGFVVLARPSPSVLRAAVMGSLALIALATGRPRAALPGLAATVLVLMFVSPDLGSSPGFAMSALATAGLLLLAPAWARTLRGWRVPGGLAEALAIATAAHLASAPLIAAISGQVSVVSIPANVLAEPAVAPATVLGVAAAVVAPASASAAAGLAWVAGWPARWIVGVAVHGAALPDAVLTWPTGTGGALLLAVSFAALLLLLRWRASRRITVAALVGSTLVLLMVRLVAPGWPPSDWVLLACDVGQGDGLILNAGGGDVVVVDTGLQPGPIAGCLRAVHAHRVRLLIASHLDADHVDGVPGVFAGRRVDAVVTGPLRDPAAGWAALSAAASDDGLGVTQLSAPHTWRFGGLTLEVLGPTHVAHGTESDPNNSTLVIRATVGGERILLTGDAGPEEQHDLVSSGADLRADVLKVPHHGSAHFDPAFLAATGARLAVISVGAHNDYGQPAPPLLAALRKAGMRIDRTDQEGSVAVCLRSGSLSVSTHHSRAPPG
jgi:competence protein ComEC